jgi:hypothetical protein
VTKWEYRVEAYEAGIDEFQAILNQRGEEGWELTALLPPDSMSRPNQSMQEAIGSTPAMLHLVFKRTVA